MSNICRYLYYCELQVHLVQLILRAAPSHELSIMYMYNFLTNEPSSDFFFFSGISKAASSWLFRRSNVLTFIVSVTLHLCNLDIFITSDNE